MNILNENEAIVINSLENWEKVAEILDEHNVRWRGGRASEWTPRNKPDFRIMLEHGFLVYEVECLGYTKGKTLIQDTEFIAKHSKPLNQTNMKIKVLKDTGLFRIGNIYKTNIVANTRGDFWQLWNDNILLLEIEPTIFDLWRTNGYIEEVKEISYRFQDIDKLTCFYTDNEIASLMPAFTEKQNKQMQAFAKLTHVRAKILKDAGYSEDWEPELSETVSFVEYDIQRKTPFARHINYHVSLGVLVFPKDLAQLALDHNQELFKTYLGV